MTRVCLIGAGDADLRYELLSRETARAALATYDLTEPYDNTIALETVSLGAAVALLNDLQWYLVRFTDAALVKEPSISETEWLSRDLAAQVRDRELPPEETDRRLQIFGVDDGRLVEPMYATRVAGSVPSYDLRAVDETVIVRITDDEFGG
ncbi:DUF5804 family protein [Halohasta salina]|uniref:DUF5804 family protein n=1 Tax=Halohasta salina TaxID=2961621 RepID=UPI0020A4A6FC|nr:DUF5804 family protein [Halohasta salina]